MQLLTKSCCFLFFIALIVPNIIAINQEAFEQTQLISLSNILVHLDAFEVIALNIGGGSRSAASPGYNASVDYIVDNLKATNYTVTVQPFSFQQTVTLAPAAFSQISPSQVTYKENVDFSVFAYSGSGQVQASIQAGGDGCSASNFSSFTAGNIAVVARGTCDFSTKVDNAVNAGAVGVVIYNYQDSGIAAGTLGSVKTVPVFGTSYTLATNLLASTTVPVLSMVSNMQIQTIYTSNVIADTNFGNEDTTSTIVVGSHLDSVPAGAGINDNGSGSATNLEMALNYYRTATNVSNRVRFAWWGAEELGLLGSTYYVNSIKQSGEINNVALNLNFDMLGSPNFFRGVYNGNEAPAGIRPQSVNIANIFTSFYQFENLAWNYTEFDGRSDYGPFIENGVSAGGLFSGAEEIKPPEFRKGYGGIALASFDTCYHLNCDNTENISNESLDQSSRAAYYSLITLAKQQNLRSWLSVPQAIAGKGHKSLPFKTSIFTTKN